MNKNKLLLYSITYTYGLVVTIFFIISLDSFKACRIKQKETVYGFDLYFYYESLFTIILSFIIAPIFYLKIFESFSINPAFILLSLKCSIAIRNIVILFDRDEINLDNCSNNIVVLNYLLSVTTLFLILVLISYIISMLIFVFYIFASALYIELKRCFKFISNRNRNYMEQLDEISLAEQPAVNASGEISKN